MKPGKTICIDTKMMQYHSGSVKSEDLTVSELHTQRVLPHPVDHIYKPKDIAH